MLAKTLRKIGLGGLKNSVIILLLDQKRTRKMNALQTLQAQLAAIDTQIAAQTIAAKALDKLQKCRLNARTAPKYFELQQAYMSAVTRK